MALDEMSQYIFWICTWINLVLDQQVSDTKIRGTTDLALGLMLTKNVFIRGGFRFYLFYYVITFCRFL